MHVIANRSQLLENLVIVERAVPSRTTMPVINGILLEATAENMSFSATNVDIGIKSSNSVMEVLQEGQVVLPVKFVDILRQLSDEKVEIKSDPENFRTELNSGKSNFVLYGMATEEFPSFTPEEEWKKWTHLNFLANEFKKIFRKVIFAVSNDESKPSFRGILLEMDEQGLITCLASDTYRLACLQQQMPVEQGEINAFRLLVPGKSLNELLRIIEDSPEDKVSGYFKDNEIIFVYRQFTFYLRLLEDRYPNLMNVFPGNHQTRVTVSASNLERTISRALLLAQGYNNMISLIINDGVLKVKAGSDMGRMEEELELDGKKGENLEEILINARFFLDPLRILDKEFIDLEFNGYLGPCIFNTGSLESSSHYRYLILPIKVDKQEE